MLLLMVFATGCAPAPPPSDATTGDAAPNDAIITDNAATAGDAAGLPRTDAAPPAPPAEAVRDLSEVAEVAVIRDKVGGVMIVTVRSEAPLSDTASARLATPKGVVTAPLAGLPTQRREGNVVATTATYTLAAGDVAAANASGTDATLTLTVGGERRTFAVVRSDVFE